MASLGQGVKGGLGALPGSGNLFGDTAGALPLPGAPTKPAPSGKGAGAKPTPRVAPRQNTQPLMPLPDPTLHTTAPPPTPLLNQPDPMGQAAALAKQQAQQQSENRTLNALATGQVGINSPPDVKLMIMQPTPRITDALNDSKDLMTAYQAAYKTVTGHIADSSALGNKQAAALGLPVTGVPWLQRLAGETGNMLIGLGPGLAHQAVGEGQDLANAGAAAVNDTLGAVGLPQGRVQGNFDFSHTRQFAGALEHSYGQTINHPSQQLSQDPLAFISNVATPFFMGAGGIARGAELAGTAEDAGALTADTAAGRAAQTVGHAVTHPGSTAKTLLRPQPQQREISTGEGGLTLKPPAYKSALGGLAQTRVLDPLLERHLAQPSPFAAAGQRISNFFHAPKSPLSAGARFGRKARNDLESDIRIRAGALATRMPEEQAASLARGTALSDRHRALYAGGTTSDQAALQPWRDWAAIKPPPADTPMKDPQFLTPADLKAHPYLQQSESGLARQFEKGSSMIASDKDAMESPDKFRYVPQELINSMKTYQAPKGALSTAANVIDRGTQVIRSGRFLTPAYSLWAPQNGLIHLSQAGAFVFRNAWQLKNEWPKLPEEVRGAIDGGMGKGIAKATSGGEAAEGGKLAQSMANIQHFWHKFDDQWARRMSAIHELNSSGYHDAGAWQKLYRQNPAEFRKIVGGQGNREAINYTEMTPAERQTFQKLFTAYGWTRGASTYAARFPLQHPIQARAGVALGQEGTNIVQDYYKKLGGMVPNWLRGYLPIGGSKLLDTSSLNPAGTLGSLIQEIPGATQGQTESALGELAPIPGMIEELMSGANKYGTAYKGNQKLLGPIEEAANRFKPLAAFQTFLGTKKGGTFVSGRQQGLEQMAGSPVTTLRNPTNTAALGEKDYEQSLSETQKIQFQYNQGINNLPAELKLYQHVTGGPLDGATISRLKNDYDQVEQRDLFQYHYAQVHGAKSWKSLPPVNKWNGTIDWLQHHGYSHQTIAQLEKAFSQLHDDKSIESAVNALWQGTGIGSAVSAWKSVVKGMKPPVLTKANP